MLCLLGFGTHANFQNVPHFRAFPASIQEHSPPKCLYFMANSKLPNRPGFALLCVQGGGSEEGGLLVRRTGVGRFRRGGGLRRWGGFLRTLWRPLQSSTPSCRPSDSLRLRDGLLYHINHLCMEYFGSAEPRGKKNANFSKQGSTPTPWARGLRDQIQKWALQTQKTLYFGGFLCSEGD